MAANAQPIFPVAPVIGIATLTAATAITSRANITGTTGLTQLTPVSTNGKRVDSITVKGKGTSVPSILSVWLYNGTTSFLYDEIDISAVTASNTVDSVLAKRFYSDLILPPTFQLYISETVQTDVNVFANGGDY
jgi:hypothetical protein